jgi:type I restriction enzyme M protein
MNQTQINNIVWKACDSFRGTIDPSQYKDYILTMMFVKYLSDLWDETVDKYRRQYGDNKQRMDRALENERFFVSEESTFRYLYEHRKDNNIGDLINKALMKLEEENSSKLQGVFRSIDFNSEANLGTQTERNVRLRNLLQDLSELDLHPAHLEGRDVIGDSYEFLISKFAATAGKKAGEYFTPPKISALLAKLISPIPGNRVYDPTCGSGSLLIKVAKEVGSPNFSLYGQEINGSTWSLAKMNMFLHNLDRAQIERGDTLRNPRFTEGTHLTKFDIVIANPPFSLDKWGYEELKHDVYGRFERGLPPKTKGDYGFILQMIESAFEESGRVGVIVAHGVLFRGAAEGEIRKKLIDENLLDAVVGLPPSLFYGTGIPGAILIFDKGKKHSDVLFIDASKEFEAGKKQNKLRDEDILHITRVYNQYKNEKPMKEGKGQVIEARYAYRATITDLKDNDYNLNIPRYVDTYEPTEKIDIRLIQTEIASLESQLTSIEKQMRQHLNDLGL